MRKKRRSRIEPAARARMRENPVMNPLAGHQVDEVVSIEASKPAEPHRRTGAVGREAFRAGLHEEWTARVQDDYAYVKRDLKRMVSISTLVFTIMFLVWIVVEVVGFDL